MLAALEGHADCARLLLGAGADANAKTKVRVCVPVLCVVLVAWGGGDEHICFSPFQSSCFACTFVLPFECAVFTLGMRA